MQEEQLTSFFRRAGDLVSLAVGNALNGKREHLKRARDDCVRANAILDLLKLDLAPGSPTQLQIETASDMLAYQIGMLEHLIGGGDEKADIATTPPHASTIPKVTPEVGLQGPSSLALNLPGMNVPRFKFTDIVGNSFAKQILHENVVLPLTLSLEAKKKLFAGRIRRGTGSILLYGPPGTGKTLLAQAAATESNAMFFNVRPSDLLSKYQGDSERFLKQLFQEARSVDRSVIFFDEFDSIAVVRGSDDGAQSRRILSELLLQMTNQKQISQQLEGLVSDLTNAMMLDGPSQQLHSENDNHGNDTELHCISAEETTPRGCLGKGLAIIAATNRIDDIDDAVLRRFEVKCLIDLPDITQRIALIANFNSDIDHNLSERDMQFIAEQTDGWSGSEIETLAREASLAPLRFVFPYYGSADNNANLQSIKLRSVELNDYINILKSDHQST